jgi:iron complex outermembrane receptor protein
MDGDEEMRTRACLIVRYCTVASVLAVTTAGFVASASAQATSPEQAMPADDAPANGDIVVTAQRVQTLASKTPVALSAISGEELAQKGINNPLKLADEVPNLSIVNNNGLQITIRGISSNDNTEKGDPSAAFLLNGVYIARPQVQNVSFYDVKRVEVLRGPQGTLYGRNTTAGVVNVITNAPTGQLEIAANGTVGSYGARRADAMLNLPVSDQLSLRFSGAYDRADLTINPEPGELYSMNPGRNNLSGRMQALFKPTSAFSILLRADYTRMRGIEERLYQVIGSRFYGAIPAGQPSYTNQPYIGGNSSSSDLRRLGFLQAGDSYLRGSTWGIDGEVNWDFGPVTATYLGSYREFARISQTTRTATTTFNYLDGDYSQQSHELRFATNGTGPFKMQFGGYYFAEKSHTLQIGGIVNAFDMNTKAKNYGVFGQATYSITENFRLTAGTRYSKDDKSRVGITYRPTTGAIISPNNAATQSDKVTWRLGLDYDASAATFVYGSISTGYKAGAFNDGCGTDVIGCPSGVSDSLLYYRPEQITAYEVGVKSRAFDGAMRFALSGFYYDYIDLQVSSTIQVNGSNQTFTRNAASATVKGVEFETTLKPDSRHQIDLGLTYLDATYGQFRPLGAGVAPDYAGRSLDRAPKFVASLGYSYALPLANDASLTFSARSRYSSRYFIVSQTSGGQFEQPRYTKTNLSLRYDSSGGRYHFGVFVRNIEGNIQVSAANVAGARVLVAPTEPRTFGLQAGFDF